MEIGRIYRRTLKEGMTGHEVWALQLNLNTASAARLATDGIFGPMTRAAVTAFQKTQGLVVDGIAGILTQRALSTVFMTQPEMAYRLPSGLLYGITEGESGFAVGAVNWSVSGGVDLGWLQRRVTDVLWSPTTVTSAFDGVATMKHGAEQLRTWKDRYASQLGSSKTRDAWRYSVLRWNWPAAADRFANGTISSWLYRERWTDSTGAHSATRRMDEPAVWIKAIGVPNVTTGYQWADHYITTKTAYVKSWTV